MNKSFSRKHMYNQSRASRGCRDDTYHGDNDDNLSNDSRTYGQEETTCLQMLAKHTTCCSDLEVDLTKPYHPTTFAEKSKFIPRIATAPFPVPSQCEDS